MAKQSIILNTDSYKISQFAQLPKNTDFLYSYIESRGGNSDKVVNFGLQAFLREVLSKPIAASDIYKAEMFCKVHGEPFNKEGWEYILKEYGGYLPLAVYGIDEGIPVPVKTPVVAVVNTDPKCAWLTSYIETAILRAVWYPSTVATRSREVKEVIRDYLLATEGNVNSLDFKLIDFGKRGSSSYETSGLGAMAHLINFKGTDTISGIFDAMEYYDSDICGFSIPASEHSCVCSWGRENEIEMYRNMIRAEEFKDYPLVACVSDTYDIFEACRMWNSLADEIKSLGKTIVIRPDSGDPMQVIPKMLSILSEGFGFTVNSLGYKVLNNCRIIWGDGIDVLQIKTILFNASIQHWSAENFAFGSGGWLLQSLNRDTHKFAMKASCVFQNGEWIGIAKDPVTDQGKKSKTGIFHVSEDFTVTDVSGKEDNWDFGLLKLRYRNGRLYNQIRFDEVRKNAEI